MALTGNYQQSEEHQCDACSKVANCKTNRQFESLPDVPDNWVRVRTLTRDDRFITQHTVELCDECATKPPWQAWLAALEVLYNANGQCSKVPINSQALD